MVAVRVEGSDALFESKQALVDLCSLETSLPIVTLAVGGSLRSRKVD